MIKVAINGGSDDLIEVIGCRGGDEFNCLDSPYVGYCDLVSESTMGRMRVHAIYDGCWSFAFGQCEEDDPDPQWMITTTWEGYSSHHVIEVPNDTVCIPCDRWK